MDERFWHAAIPSTQLLKWTAGRLIFLWNKEAGSGP